MWYLLGSLEVNEGEIWVNITFYDSDIVGTNPHDNDPMVIIVRHDNWDIKWVLINLGSSVDVLFWDAFQKLQLNPSKVKVFRGSLIRLSSKRVQVNDHVTLETTCREGADTNMINVYYLIMDFVSPYNIILGRSAINTIERLSSLSI